MPPAERRAVLVVEDDQATRAFLLDNLTADGFRAVGAGGAGEGPRAIEVRQPALVILDLILEDGSGLELLDRVRAADGLASRIDPELPVIVLTGRAGEADRVRSFARGADDHVSKAFTYASAAKADSSVHCRNPRLICSIGFAVDGSGRGPMMPRKAATPSSK